MFEKSGLASHGLGRHINLYGVRPMVSIIRSIYMDYSS